MHLHKLKTHNFSFEAGGTLDQLEIVYHTSERPYQQGDRVVWLCHALTANSDPLDWWPEMVGEGCCVNPDSDYVVCVNIFGSAYGTTGPRDFWSPDSGDRNNPLSFPKFTVRDIARLFTLVREHLGIEQVDLLIGSSIGGFHALEWAIMEGEVIRKAAFIATAPRVSPWLSAWMEVQRMALEADPTFRACESLDGGRKGLEAARAISLISYRSFDVDKMQQAAGYLVGEHDFKSFCQVGAQVDSTVRTLYSVEVEEQGSDLVIRVCGNGFLYNMVRIIAGTLMDVGQGRKKPEEMVSILEAKDRSAAGPTAPAHGLMLMKYEFPGEQ